MNFSIDPLSLAPAMSTASQAMGMGGMPNLAFEKAVMLQPMMADDKAAAQILSLDSHHLNPLSAQAGLNPLNGMATHADAQIRKVAKDFEAIFMRMLFKEMRNTVQKSDIWGNSPSMNLFESMSDDQLSKAIASAGGIGIGNMVYQRMKAATASHIKTST